jgi:hypothetical protein
LGVKTELQTFLKTIFVFKSVVILNAFESTILMRNSYLEVVLPLGKKGHTTNVVEAIFIIQ